MKLKNGHLEKLIRIVYRYWKKNFAKHNKSCLDEQTLACFIDGLLSPEDTEAVKTHLISCDKCSEAIAVILKIKL